MLASSWSTSMMLLCVGLGGCSRYPAAPDLPKISAQAAGAEAIELYDANGDEKLAFEECMKSLTMLAAWRMIDKDEDQFLTAEEISARVRSWQESPSFIVDAMPTFYWNEEPLEGATVTLELAEFLGDSYPSFSAVTNADGKAHFRLEDPRYPGIYPGIYKMSVSKQQDGQEMIPAIYNTESQLACEFSNENWLSCYRRYRLRPVEE